MPNPGTPTSPAHKMLDQIRALHAEGRSRLEIARQLGLTKSAVCGVVRRHIQLIKGPVGGPKRGERSPARTAAMEALAEAQRAKAAAKREAARQRRLAAAQAFMVRVGPSPARCQYPIGEPRRPGFRFCDKPAVAGRPYCVACMKRCYVLRAA